MQDTFLPGMRMSMCASTARRSAIEWLCICASRMRSSLPLRACSCKTSRRMMFKVVVLCFSKLNLLIANDVTWISTCWHQVKPHCKKWENWTKIYYKIVNSIMMFYTYNKMPKISMSESPLTSRANSIIDTIQNTWSKRYPDGIRKSIERGDNIDNFLRNIFQESRKKW